MRNTEEVLGKRFICKRFLEGRAEVDGACGRSGATWTGLDTGPLAMPRGLGNLRLMEPLCVLSRMQS